MQSKIEQGARAMGIDLPEGAAQTMADFWSRLLITNSTMNLTRITQEDEACDAHFLDSLAPLQFGEGMIPQGARVCDVGTGGGFPGVPLLLARPDISMSFLDARAKKLRFVQSTLDALGVEATYFHTRIQDCTQRFDVVLARAVAPLPDLCTWVASLLAPGGLGILWKGPAAAQEAQAVIPALQGQGLQLFEPVVYHIPGRDWERYLYTIG